MAYNITNNSGVLFNEANIALSIINPIIIKVITAILIFLIGFVIGKIVQRLIIKFFEISDLDKLFKKKIGLKFSVSKVTAAIISYFIYIISIVMALNKLEIATTIVTTIVIVLVIILILFVIFGLNDVFANLLAGFMVKFKKNIKAGDYIRISDKRIEGYIVSMNLLNIRLETKKDEMVFIPNMILFKSEIVKPKKIPKH
jgi:small-conductance mechanosensitive channel